MSSEPHGAILDRVATAAEHARLAASVGWEAHFDDEVRAASLTASLAGAVYVDENGMVVGMARAVGDGRGTSYKYARETPPVTHIRMPA